ncbi:MAG: Kelch repeat-containing protein [Planctomycetota bacterium]|jgi:N-acetylneuraminic acid mutarotase
MKKKISIVLVLASCMVVKVAKADFTWKQKADMLTPRWCHTSAVVNGRIYVFGGSTSEPDDEVLSSVEEYDPVTNTWTRKADMLTGRTNMIGSSAVVNGKIYVIGGDDNVVWGGPIVEEYDPVTNTWTRKADMPTSRWSLATCAVDDKIYAIGGGGNGWAGLKVVEQYDPVTDIWTRKTDMPAGLWGLCANVVNGKIYAFGGRPERNASSYTFEYDPATDTWTRKADMPVGTSQMGSVVLGDKIIVIGGWHISSRFPYTTVQIYDPETDIWTIEGDAPFMSACFSAEVVNNRIYAIGGTDRPHPCPATSTVYELSINPPSPDFNGDGFVDSADICIMIDCWGTDEPLCDIGPLPWGDGIVDVQDLIVLAEHLFEDVNDPTLVAHWALDEAEGMFVFDSAGDNDGYALGDPVWQPDGGLVDGALQLDGVDDYVITGAALNPAEGPFSVLAWVNGGAPGQVVVSQQGATNWLMTDAEGNLMTEFRSPGRTGKPLHSQTNITEGEWHRVGFVYDGANRILYVDDIAVAEDTQDALESSDSGLYIGCGKAMEAGTYWSGLIDDVRIYNRAVRP